MADIQSQLLRLGEEKKKERRNNMAKIYWSALFHRATIEKTGRRKKSQDENIMSASATLGQGNICNP